MRDMGDAIGAEFWGKGANVYFGPGLNVARLANGGRNFEYLSGEDPYLGYTLVKPLVRSVQSHRVIANAKHFMDNNQEGLRAPNSTARFGKGDRHSTSAEVDERTQMELYLPPFLGAVEAGVASFMCANNLINGEYACQNGRVQNDYLKNWSDFHGFICSDYDGTRSTVDAAEGGLDIAMPGVGGQHPGFFGGMLKKAVQDGTVDVSVVHDKAVRILYAMAVTGALDDVATATRSSDKDVTSDAHRTLARTLAAASCILLKNDDGMLPLAAAAVGGLHIAVIGAAGGPLGAIYGGSGSGKVVPKSPVSILEALEAIGKADANVITSFADGTNVTETRLKAAAADVVLVVLAQSSTEGHDRDSLELPGSSLVPIVASVNRNVIVATITPGPFLTDEWAQAAKAIIDMGLPGEQEGNGLVDVLFGAVNPSGRLPHTLPNKWNEVGMQPRQYPGVPPHNISGQPPRQPCSFVPAIAASFVPCAPTKAYYDEKLEVGYRWYNTHGVAPAFPFGHGLSYTTFAYSNLRIVSGKNGRTPRSVSVVVQNTGLRSVQRWCNCMCVSQHRPESQTARS